MKIGLTGDTHNNLKNVAIICDIFNSHNLDFVIHTGDVSLPKTLQAFDSLKFPLKGVFGNNDEGEKVDLLKICEQKGFVFKDKLKIKDPYQRRSELLKTINNLMRWLPK